MKRFLVGFTLLAAFWAPGSTSAEEAPPPEALYPRTAILFLQARDADLRGTAPDKVAAEEEVRFAAELPAEETARFKASLEQVVGVEYEVLAKAFAGSISMALVRIADPASGRPSPVLAATLAVAEPTAAKAVYEGLVRRINEISGGRLSTEAGITSLPVNGSAMINARLTSNRLIITLEEKNRFIKALGVDAGPLALGKSSRFTSAMEQVDTGGRTMLRWYVDCGNLKNEIIKMAGGQFSQEGLQANLVLLALGLDSLHSLGGAVLVEGEGFRSRALVSLSERKGLMALFSPEPVSPEVLRAIPEDVLGVQAVRMNVSKAVDIMKKQAETYFGGPAVAMQIEEVVAMVEAQSGFAFRKDFLENLTDEAALFVMAPEKSGGWLGLEGATLILGIKDRGKAEKAVETILGIAGGMIAQQEMQAGLKFHVKVKEFEYLGSKVKYVSALGILLPSFTVTDDFLIMSAGIYAPREVLRCLAGRSKSLAMSEDFSRTMARVGVRGNEAGFAYMPSGAGTATIGGANQALGAVALTGMMAGLLLPALSGARERARRVSCINNLRQTGIALHMYSQDHDEKFPGKLSELYDMYLPDVKLVVCPSSGASPPPGMDDAAAKAFIDNSGSYVYVSGLSPMDPPDMVLAYDIAGNHAEGGRNVLFVGTNVAWHTEDGFQRLLAEQRTKWEELNRRGRSVRALEPAQRPAAAAQKPLKPEDVLSVDTLLSVVDALGLGRLPPDAAYSKHNFSGGWVMRVDDAGIHMDGHFSGLPRGGGGSLVSVVGVGAVVAAIAIPNLLEARKAAEPGRRLAPPVPPDIEIPIQQDVW